MHILWLFFLMQGKKKVWILVCTRILEQLSLLLSAALPTFKLLGLDQPKIKKMLDYCGLWNVTEYDKTLYSFFIKQYAN